MLLAVSNPVSSPFLVPFDGSFRVAGAPTAPADDGGAKKERKERKKQYKDALEETIEEIRELQRTMYAADSHSVLLVFQAMDAAGKDGTIRAVMNGVNPAGCQVSSFKKPSSEELDHDFLWRVSKRLPERGRIGIFNRSHYEDVLVVRVHPEYLGGQRIPGTEDMEAGALDAFFAQRYESIRNYEQHLARNGTVVVKFWLNVSRDEQRDRFLTRIDEPASNWKFNPGDVAERKCWDAYMSAYESALNQTSRPCAPWYAVPADDKPYMRSVVADIFKRTLEGLGSAYPTLSEGDREEMLAHRAELAES
ncbi:MAG: polyphosphate kinase 2 family protein [Deltaproteobacteria bacterium]|nr:polyphosphate kinase 2 family protein [Deltaproteobacteria bacterium]